MEVTPYGKLTDVNAVHPWKVISRTDVMPLGIMIEVRLEQPEKADSPMEVTPYGKLTDVKALHSAKVLSRTDVTPSGIMIEVRFEQPEKADSPMDVILEGIERVDIPHPPNALLPMEITLFGIEVFLQAAIRVFDAVSIIALQLPLESKTVLPSSTTIDDKLLQLLKAEPSIESTLDGIVIDERLLPLNAPAPIHVIVFGKVTDVILEDPNAPPPIPTTVYFVEVV